MDLAAYLARIGVSGPLRPDLPTLERVHEAHAATIPFENLDVQMGVPISLEVADVFDKLVRRRRGGYCFEQNTLLGAALREIGFGLETYEARVRLNADGLRPRTHMLLGVRVDGVRWLADVGFGSRGLVHPLLIDGATHEQFGDAYRVTTEAGEHVLQWRRDGGWVDLYVFVPETRFAIDFVMGNHFTSTYPGSPFLANLLVQRPRRDVRHSVRNLTYSVTRGTACEERTLRPEELRPLLRDEFGIEVPVSATFRAVPGA